MRRRGKGEITAVSCGGRGRKGGGKRHSDGCSNSPWKRQDRAAFGALCMTGSRKLVEKHQAQHVVYRFRICNYI